MPAFPRPIHLALLLWLVAGSSEICGADQSLAAAAPEAEIGATLRGRILDGVTLKPLHGVVSLTTPGGFSAATASSYDDGSWELSGIPPGDLYLHAVVSGYVPQAWRGRDCPYFDCLSAGDAISVVAEGTTTGLDFNLIRHGTVAGRVIDEQSHIGLADILVDAYAYSAEHGLKNVGDGRTDSTGAFSIDNLRPGEFYLVAHAEDYHSEAFEDIEEVAFRADPTLGRKTRVAASVTTKGIEIRLKPFGKIAGRVVDAATGAPLEDCGIYIWRAEDLSRPTGIQSRCEEGEFSIGRLDAGEYHLGARADGKAPAMLGIGSCNFSTEGNFCPIHQATRIRLTQGEVREGVAFELEDGASIHATIYRGNAVQGLIDVQVLDVLDRMVARRRIPPVNANLSFDELAPGDYWLIVLGSPGNTNQAYPNGTCGRWYCNPRHGQTLTLAAGQSLVTERITLWRIAAYQGCQTTPNAICLNKGRYRIEAAWQDYQGNEGLAEGRLLTDDTGAFTFFSPANIELVVKVLEACGPQLGHRFWAFAGGLTNVGVTLRITDTLTDQTAEYVNLLGTLYAPVIDTATFATCDAEETVAAESPALEQDDYVVEGMSPEPQITQTLSASPTCVEDHQQLCLAAGRFKITAEYVLEDDAARRASMKPISTDAAYITFFSQWNVELLVKVLDACDVYGKFWFFATGLTDVYSTIKVEDTVTGRVAEYGGFDGAFQPIIDIATFSCN